eukprot:COSAG01_NODE_1144_length_11530_cov_4.888549_7_plen_469_part_00
MCSHLSDLHLAHIQWNRAECFAVLAAELRWSTEAASSRSQFTSQAPPRKQAAAALHQSTPTMPILCEHDRSVVEVDCPAGLRKTSLAGQVRLHMWIEHPALRPQLAGLYSTVEGQRQFRKAVAGQSVIGAANEPIPGAWLHKDDAAFVIAFTKAVDTVVKRQLAKEGSASDIDNIGSPSSFFEPSVISSEPDLTAESSGVKPLIGIGQPRQSPRQHRALHCDAFDAAGSEQQQAEGNDIAQVPADKLGTTQRIAEFCGSHKDIMQGATTGQLAAAIAARCTPERLQARKAQDAATTMHNSALQHQVSASTHSVPADASQYSADAILSAQLNALQKHVVNVQERTEQNLTSVDQDVELLHAKSAETAEELKLLRSQVEESATEMNTLKQQLRSQVEESTAEMDTLKQLLSAREKDYQELKAMNQAILAMRPTFFLTSSTSVCVAAMCHARRHFSLSLHDVTDRIGRRPV